MKKQAQGSSGETTNEWIAGFAALPVPDAAGEAPELLLFASPEGVVGHRVGDVGSALLRAEEAFRSAVREPLVGTPGAPTTLRVASKDLADVLRAPLAGMTEVVHAPTPELDPLFASMAEHLQMAGATMPPTLAASDASPEAMTAFFQAAARLHRAAPWSVVPEETLVEIDVPSLGVTGRAVAILGQHGESFALIAFESAEEFDAFLDHEAAPNVSLNFEQKDHVPASLREEVAARGWEVDEDAYPIVVPADGDLAIRPVTAADYLFWEVACSAVAALLETEPHVAERLEDEGGLEAKLTVNTSSGAVDVSMAVSVSAYESVDEIAEAIGNYVLEREENPFGVRYVATCLAIAAEVHEKGIDDIDPELLRVILLKDFREHAKLPSTEVPRVVPSLRAFFAHREGERAEACAEALDATLSAELVKRFAGNAKTKKRVPPRKARR